MSKFMVFEFPEDVVFDTKDGKVVIALPKDEAAELLTWLNLMDTGWLTDNQYMYFVGFKDRLREQINKLPVAESFVQTEAPPNS